MAAKNLSIHRNKIVIIGNPNVGKSVLFNQITKAYSLIANVPYTTISVHRADITVENTSYEIIDTPGILSLDVHSEDGLITRNILLKEHPEVIILCIDSTNLKRSLLLLAQIMELEIPMVLCLNFLDESRQRGVIVEKDRLEQMLDIPVVETVASEGWGVSDLVKALPKAVVPAQSRVAYKRFIEEGLTDIAQCFPPDSKPPVGILLLLVMQDRNIEHYIELHYGDPILRDVKTLAAKVHNATQKGISRFIFEARERWAATLLQEVVQVKPESTGKYSKAIGSLCRHPFWGWLILIGVVYSTYLLVGKIGIGFLVPFCEQKIFFPLLDRLALIIPWEPLREFLVGDYGILSSGFVNAVGTALPILSMFFIILNFLEDTGYISNLCILTNRLFRRLGLSGKAILPVILGFGCKTMATLTARILESRKERIIAIFLIGFAIPCAPLLGINLAILALFPFKAFLIVFGVFILAEIVAGILLNKVLKADVVADFIMEIPPIRLPGIKSLLLKTYYRLKWFTTEAIPLFMIGAGILYVMEKLYILDFIKRACLPVLATFLNLPLSTVDSFLLCLLRKEAGAVVFLELAQTGQLDYIQIIVGIVVINCFIPCFANIMAMIRLLGVKTALLVTFFITFFSAVLGSVVNYVLRIF